MMRTILGLVLIAGITCCQGKPAAEFTRQKQAASYDIDAKDLKHGKGLLQVDGLWGVYPTGHQRPGSIVESKEPIFVPKGARVRVEMWHKAWAYGVEKNVVDFQEKTLFVLGVVLKNGEGNLLEFFHKARFVGELFPVFELGELIETGDKSFFCSPESRLRGVSAEAVATQDSYLSFHVDVIGQGGGVFIKDFIIDIL